MNARHSSPSGESASFRVAGRASAIARIVNKLRTIGWGGRIRTSDWLIQNLYPASWRSTNDERREGPTSTAETVALPELTLEDRVAVALARRGALKMFSFIKFAQLGIHPTRDPGPNDDEFVANLERAADALEVSA